MLANSQKEKNSTTSQTQFGFTNMGSKMHRFNNAPFYFSNFSMGHPVNACFIISSSLSLLLLWLIKLICECKMLAGKPINKGSKRQILPSKVHLKHY